MKNSFRLALLFSLIIVGASFGQLPENNIFSFITDEGKTVALSSAQDESYIVLRVTLENDTLFKFPEKLNETSWQKFNYSFWLRGGGTENLGIDLNYLYFSIDNCKYVLYQTYFAEEERGTKICLKIIDTETGNIIDNRGLLETQNGSLTELRENNKIAKGEELFD